MLDLDQKWLFEAGDRYPWKGAPGTLQLCYYVYLTRSWTVQIWWDPDLLWTERRSAQISILDLVGPIGEPVRWDLLIFIKKKSTCTRFQPGSVCFFNVNSIRQLRTGFDCSFPGKQVAFSFFTETRSDPDLESTPASLTWVQAYWAAGKQI